MKPSPWRKSKSQEVKWVGANSPAKAAAPAASLLKPAAAHEQPEPTYDERMANLFVRFPQHSEAQIREAMRASDGHAGQAAQALKRTVAPPAVPLSPLPPPNFPPPSPRKARASRQQPPTSTASRTASPTPSTYSSSSSVPAPAPAPQSPVLSRDGSIESTSKGASSSSSSPWRDQFVAASAEDRKATLQELGRLEEMLEDGFLKEDARRRRKDLEKLQEELAAQKGLLDAVATGASETTGYFRGATAAASSFMSRLIGGGGKQPEPVDVSDSNLQDSPRLGATLGYPLGS